MEFFRVLAFHTAFLLFNDRVLYKQRIHLFIVTSREVEYDHLSRNLSNTTVKLCDYLKNLKTVLIKVSSWSTSSALYHTRAVRLVLSNKHHMQEIKGKKIKTLKMESKNDEKVIIIVVS